MTKFSGIYNIRNKISNKIYIGSTINIYKREQQHKNLLNKNNHKNKILQNAFNKYGKENFQFEIIEYLDDKEKLIEREQNWIDFFKPEYNIRKIAENNLGIKFSKESKQKLRISHKGFKGKKHSEETKLKISISHKGMKDRKHSEEAKLKMSIARKGFKISEETRKKISITSKGRKCSLETRKKISNALKGNTNGLKNHYASD